MRFILHACALATTFGLVACGEASGVAHGSNARSTTTSNAGVQSATISGEAAHAVVGGDRIAIDEGKVYLNGVAYGRVKPDSQVTYVVSAKERVLLVDGVPRTSVK